jgi:hypothetical protein
MSSKTVNLFLSAFSFIEIIFFNFRTGLKDENIHILNSFYPLVYISESAIFHFQIKIKSKVIEDYIEAM